MHELRSGQARQRRIHETRHALLPEARDALSPVENALAPEVRNVRRHAKMRGPMPIEESGRPSVHKRNSLAAEQTRPNNTRRQLSGQEISPQEEKTAMRKIEGKDGGRVTRPLSRQAPSASRQGLSKADRGACG
jgi:hypothetical protein